MTVYTLSQRIDKIYLSSRLVVVEYKDGHTFIVSGDDARARFWEIWFHSFLVGDDPSRFLSTKNVA